MCLSLHCSPNHQLGPASQPCKGRRKLLPPALPKGKGSGDPQITITKH